MIGLPWAGERMLFVDIIEHASFDLCLDRKRNVHGHLVTVEVGVESRANQRMKLNGFAFDQHRLESLDPEAVQGRSAVQEHRMFLNHFFEDIPDFLGASSRPSSLRS